MESGECAKKMQRLEPTTSPPTNMSQ